MAICEFCWDARHFKCRGCSCSVCAAKKTKALAAQKVIKYRDTLPKPRVAPRAVAQVEERTRPILTVDPFMEEAVVETLKEGKPVLYVMNKTGFTRRQVTDIARKHGVEVVQPQGFVV